MAASIRVRNLTFVPLTKCFSTSVSCKSRRTHKPRQYPKPGQIPYPDLKLVVHEDAVYPDIKPKYPPGVWDNFKPRKAWEYYTEAQVINDIPKSKEKLEHIGGTEPIPLWAINTIDDYPSTLSYKQYITKTHVNDESGLPSEYYKDIDEIASDLLDSIKPQLLAIIRQEHVHHLKYSDMGTIIDPLRTSVISQILSLITVTCAQSNPHILSSQMDTDVRLETFWRRSGYSRKGVSQLKHPGADYQAFSAKSLASHQIRNEMPLPEILPWNNELCLGQVEDYPFNPSAFGERYGWDRPLTVSGHWIGDPCEFTQLSIYTLGEEYDELVVQHGLEIAEEETLSCGLVHAFTSAVAQAHNQGFNWFSDITYPLTSQTIISDGRMFRFIAYQLNTIHLWRCDEGHRRRNLLWYTDAMRLYDSVENGEVLGFNDEVLKSLLAFVLKQPTERKGVNLRPHLPDDPSPSNIDKHINFLGEDPIEQPKIGRFQYPRNALYF